MPLVDMPELALNTPFQGVPDPMASPSYGPAVRDRLQTADEHAAQEAQRPELSQTIGAAFRQNNLIGSFLSAQDMGLPHNVEPGFDVAAELKGTSYERDHWDRFTDIFNRKAMELRKAEIDKEEQDRKTLDQSGWVGTLSNIGAGVLDPTILLPVAGVVRTARGVSIARSALAGGLSVGAGVAAQEAGLHATQQLRTPQESAIAIGSSMVLGGLLGAGVAGLLSRAEQKAATAALDRLRAPSGSEVAPEAAIPAGVLSPSSGGAAAAPVADRGDLTIAGGLARKVAEGTAELNPNLRLNTSPSTSSRLFGQQLAENTLFQNMHDAGQTTGAAVETLMRTTMHGRLADATAEHNAIFSAMRKAGVAMSREDFENAIGQAMRRGDVGENDFITQAAQSWRQKLFDPFKQEAIGEGLLPPDVSVDTADSYFRRLYNVQRLTAEEQRFKGIVAGHYEGALQGEFKGDQERLQSRLDTLGQEEADLNLSPLDRGIAQEQVRTDLDQLHGNNPEHVDRLDRLNEFRREMARASDAGDKAAYATAQKAAAAARQEGGKTFAAFLEQRTRLNARLRNVEMNYAGLAEKSDAVMQQLADIEEANQRSMQRLIQKGRAFEREAQRLAPERLQQKVDDLRAAMADQAERAAKAAARARKGIEKINADAERRAAKATHIPKAKAAPRPQSLLEFLMGRGVKDEGGQLSHTGLDKARIPFKGSLVRKDGMTLDRAREAAVEAGYLRDAGWNNPDVPAQTTVSDLLDALTNDYHAYANRSHGGRIYAEMDHGAAEAFHTKERIAHEQELIDAFKGMAREDGHDVSDASLMERAAVYYYEHGGSVDNAVEHAAIHMEDAGGIAAIADHMPADIRERRDAAMQKRLDKEAISQEARAERLGRLAERLRHAEGLDVEAMLDEVRNSVGKMADEVSGVAMSRGERVQRLQEKLKDLDPQRIKDRLKAVAELKKDFERKFFDKWEIARGGERVDVAKGVKPKFGDYASDIANAIYDKLTGRGFDNNIPDHIVPAARGPLKERTFNIPDKVIEDFLHDNIIHVGHDYARKMASEIELTRRFGSADMKDQIGKIRDEYRAMRDQLASAASVKDMREIADKNAGAVSWLKEKVKGENPEKTRAALLKYLEKSEKQDVEDVEALRDLLRGTYKKASMNNVWGRTARGLLAYNYITRLGTVLLSNISEVFRPAMVYGMNALMRDGFGTLFTGAMREARRLSIHEAKLAGQVVERVLQHRIASFAEMGDPYAAGNAVERLLDQGTRVATRWNFLTQWTDGMKAITSILAQNRILKAASKGGDDRTLAYLGIDASLRERIAKQFAEHGEDREGVMVANTEKWDDPTAVRAYRAALSKDVDSVIVTRSVGDVPLFANTAVGKLILQFKGFALASHQRVLLRGLQESPARFLGGMVAMTAMGGLATWLRAAATNRLDKISSDGNPGWWLAEGIDQSGILSVPLEFANIGEKASGVNVLKDPLRRAGAMLTGTSKGPQTLRYGSRGDFGALLGPTSGMADDLFTILKTLRAGAQGQDIQKGQKRAAVDAAFRMTPYYSYPGLRQIIEWMGRDAAYQSVGAH